MSGKATGWAFDAPLTGPTMKLVLVRMADVAQGHEQVIGDRQPTQLGVSFPSTTELAKQCDTSQRQVIRIRQVLEACCVLIELDRRIGIQYVGGDVSKAPRVFTFNALIGKESHWLREALTEATAHIHKGKPRYPSLDEAMRELIPADVRAAAGGPDNPPPSLGPRNAAKQVQERTTRPTADRVDDQRNQPTNGDDDASAIHNPWADLDTDADADAASEVGSPEETAAATAGTSNHTGTASADESDTDCRRRTLSWEKTTPGNRRDGKRAKYSEAAWLIMDWWWQQQPHPPYGLSGEGKEFANHLQRVAQGLLNEGYQPQQITRALSELGNSQPPVTKVRDTLNGNPWGGRPRSSPSASSVVADMNQGAGQLPTDTSGSGRLHELFGDDGDVAAAG